MLVCDILTAFFNEPDSAILQLRYILSIPWFISNKMNTCVGIHKIGYINWKDDNSDKDDMETKIIRYRFR